MLLFVKNIDINPINMKTHFVNPLISHTELSQKDSQENNIGIQSSINAIISPQNGISIHKQSKSSMKNSNEYFCDSSCAFETMTEEDIIKSKIARKKLLLAAIFCFFFMCGEFLGGKIANSLALMSDALHLFSDFAGLMINLFALWMSTKGATDKLSFGYHRAEIVGALFSVFLIWGLTLWLVYESIQRIMHPKNIDGKVMGIVALCGIIVNVIMGYIKLYC